MGFWRPVILLPPGYGGHRVTQHTIDATIPRRAVIAGSFDWPPKRISLERFLVEFIRRNDNVIAGLTQPQLESLLMIAIGSVWFWRSSANAPTSKMA